MAEIVGARQKILSKLSELGGGISSEEGNATEDLASHIDLSAAYIYTTVRELAREGLLEVEAVRGKGTFSISLADDQTVASEEEVAKETSEEDLENSEVEAEIEVIEEIRELTHEERIIDDVANLVSRNKELIEENRRLRDFHGNLKIALLPLTNTLRDLLVFLEEVDQQ